MIKNGAKQKKKTIFPNFSAKIFEQNEKKFLRVKITFSKASFKTAKKKLLHKIFSE